MPIDKADDSGDFFVKKEVWHATTLFATLLVIETSDLIFAVIPYRSAGDITRDIYRLYVKRVCRGRFTFSLLLAGIGC
jgi:hypothetical protein